MALATRTCRQAAIISALAVSIACSRDPAPAPPAPVTSQDTFTLAMVSDPHRTLLGTPVQRVRNLYTDFGQKQNLNVCSGQVRGLWSVEQPVADDLRRSLSRSSRAELRGGRNAELTFGLSR